MIGLKKAIKESRERDEKRNRWILTIGKKVHYHITSKEVDKLMKDAIKGFLYREVGNG